MISMLVFYVILLQFVYIVLLVITSIHLILVIIHVCHVQLVVVLVKIHQIVQVVLLATTTLHLLVPYVVDYVQPVLSALQTVYHVSLAIIYLTQQLVYAALANLFTLIVSPVSP
jgi:hypothetical protein